MCIRDSSCTGNAAKDGKVGHRVAAQTVCTVHAARHLTCCEQAGDHRAVSLQQDVYKRQDLFSFACGKEPVMSVVL